MLGRSPAEPAAGARALAGHYIVKESLPLRAARQAQLTPTQRSRQELRQEILKRLSILQGECEFLISDWLKQSALLDETPQALEDDIARAQQLLSIDEFHLEGHFEAWHRLKQAWKQAGIPAVFPRLEVRLYKVQAEANTQQQELERERREEAEEDEVSNRVVGLLRRIDPSRTPVGLEFIYTKATGPAAGIFETSNANSLSVARGARG